jgi:hypothetical protein
MKISNCAHLVKINSRRMAANFLGPFKTRQ